MDNRASSYISEDEGPDVPIEANKDPNVRRWAMIRIAMWVSPMAFLTLALIFCIWEMAAKGGGPVIGAFMFLFMADVVWIFVLLAIWYFKWIEIKVNQRSPISG